MKSMNDVHVKISCKSGDTQRLIFLRSYSDAQNFKFYSDYDTVCDNDSFDDFYGNRVRRGMSKMYNKKLHIRMGNSGLKQHYETAKKTGTLRLSQGKLDEFPQNLRALSPVLRTLDLSENKFIQLPDEIGNFTLLKQLNISHNKLTVLPEAIGALTKLEGLNVSSNQLKCLPWSLSKLTRLKQVNLSDNRLTEFPPMFCDSKFLDVLDLSKNRITTIPDAAGTLHVIELNLNQNQVSTISQKLAECPRLKTLRLEENCLQLNAIPSKLLKESKVSVLSVEGNLFEISQFANLDGYDNYMERYTAVKKKMF